MTRRIIHLALLAMLGGITVQSAGAQESGPAAIPSRVAKDVIRFETSADPQFALQSRFTGSAVIMSNAIRVQVESGELTFPEKGRAGDGVSLEGYYVSLGMPLLGGWSRISHSPAVQLQQDLEFGGRITLPATNLTIPLVNNVLRTNYCLIFTMMHPGGGYTPSHSRRDLFTNLVPSAIQTVRQSHSFTRTVQLNWDGFPKVDFARATNRNETIFQRFRGAAYPGGEPPNGVLAGVRIVVPAWMDGDLEFAVIHLSNGSGDRRGLQGYSWGMAPEAGVFSGMKDVERVSSEDFLEMRASYPSGAEAYTGRAVQESLVPGSSYVLWWMRRWPLPKGTAPEFAIALTLVSKRGREEFGEIRWR